MMAPQQAVLHSRMLQKHEFLKKKTNKQTTVKKKKKESLEKFQFLKFYMGAVGSAQGFPPSFLKIEQRKG